MSNYLNSLIARARGPSSRIEPRLRSIFEPVVPVMPESTPSIVAEGKEGVGPTQPSAFAASPPPEVRGAPELPASALRPLNSVVAPVSSPARLPRVEERGAQASADRAADDPHDDLLLPLRSARVDPLAPFPPGQPAKKQEPAHSPRTDLLESAGHTNGGPVTPAPAATLSASVTRPRASTPLRSANAARAPVTQRDSLPPRSDASAPPAIHVTIGRVDVRALFPSAVPAPSRSERPTPKVTLEKYLEARNGGGR